MSQVTGMEVVVVAMMMIAEDIEMAETASGDVMMGQEGLQGMMLDQEHVLSKILKPLSVCVYILNRYLLGLRISDSEIPAQKLVITSYIDYLA